MKKGLLFICLLFASCSSTPVGPTKVVLLKDIKINISENVAEKIETLLQGELNYIQNISEADFKDELLSALSSLKNIDYQIENCTRTQVACSDKMHPNTIFINQNFFKIPAIEQFTAILHESKHLSLANFEHAKCLKKPEWGYECDESLNSSYGIEYKYLLHKYINTKDEQIARVLQKIFLRINKI